MAAKLLVIEDDPTLNQLLTRNLERKGFEVLSATHGKQGLRLAYQNHPDLVILDVMMPEIDGWQVCERLREVSDVPIVLLTAKISQDDVMRGLQLGADDYVKKPFNLSELELRIKAILRRTSMEHRDYDPLYEDSTLRIHLERRQILRHGTAVHLTPTEFRLLSYLVRNRGHVVPREELLTEVWGPEYIDDTSCLSLYIRYLRAKLEEVPSNPQYIRTEWGVGYRFMPANKNAPVAGASEESSLQTDAIA